MPINVSGPGARGGVGATNPTNAQLNPVAPPNAGQRAAVGDAFARGLANDSSLGSVGGQQFANPGASGVTSYGLFGGGGSGQSAAPSTPPMQPPSPGPSPGVPHNVQPRPPMMQIPTQPGIIAHPKLNNGGGSMGGFSVGASTPSTTGAMPKLPPGLPSMQQRIAAAPRLIGQQRPAPPMGMAQRAPTMPLRAPPPAPGGTMQAQSSGGGGTPPGAAPPAGASPGSVSGFNAGDNTDNTALHPVNQDGTRSDGQTGQDTRPTDGGAATGMDSLTAAANGALTSAGGVAGQSLADLIAGYNQGMGGQADPSFSQFFNQMAPGFQENSLTNAVGQNMQQMMDPAAWEQSAQNQLANDLATNTSSLNEGERRLQDQAGRSGLANTGGADSALLRNFSNQQSADARNVFNDTLGHQMDAANMASSYANGLRGQDTSRSNMLTGIAGQGAGQDLANAREDNPSLIKVLQSLMGGAGAAAGAGAQGLGSLASLLPLLAAA